MQLYRETCQCNLNDVWIGKNMENDNENQRNSYMVRITGYHGTCSSAQESIERYGLDPARTKNRPDHWLGQGVYFFLQQDQARWWAEDIAGKNWNHGSVALVYSADIVADQKYVRDFREYEDVAQFQKWAVELLNSLNEGDEAKPKLTTEKFRGLLFDYYKTEYNIYVMIGSFSKNRVGYASYDPREEELRLQKAIMKTTGIYYQEVQVCVSNQACIQNQKVEYVGEVEVI